LGFPKQVKEIMPLHIQNKVNILSKKKEDEDWQKSFKLSMSQPPYPSKICFSPLINHLKEKALTAKGAEKMFIDHALKTFEETEGFNCTFDNKEELKPYQELINLLLSGLFPLTDNEDLLAMISGPFDHDPFYLSPQLEKFIQNGHGITQVDGDIMHDIDMKSIWAGCQILDKFYGQNLRHFPNFFFKTKNNAYKSERYFRSTLNFNFIDISLLKPLKKLSAKDIKKLLNNIDNIALWREALPPENFEFKGFVIGKMTDITQEEAISNFKEKLLERDALTNIEKLSNLQEEMRILLEDNEIELGITALDYPEKNVLHQYKIRENFLSDLSEELMPSSYPNSVYHKACERGEPILIADLQELKNQTFLEKKLLERNFRSIIVYPLKNEDNRILGLLELGVQRPDAFNSFTLHTLRKVINLFKLAIERSREEIDNKIEAVIREEYTTLHESVEWKFIEQAYDVMNHRENPHSEPIHAKPIKFPDVYPLFGQADIVGSSVIRNESIQADLLKNLEETKEVLTIANKRSSFPLTELHLQSVQKYIARLRERIQSSDESEIVDFLHQTIHPYFSFLEKENTSLSRSIKLYFNTLDDDFQIIYDKRKNYERSVSILNKKIGNYLEKQQNEAQKIIPHYFEKYATDGVEFEIYAGKSITHKKEFTDLHLRNLRLWQLHTMCEITRSVADLQDKLPVPLTTAQMIFVYSLPVSIRFLLDEKHFDVDGAYNVRYKILKKRIDKAVVQNTGERVTVSGKIAIIYTTERDRLEYMEYAQYLVQKGLISEDIEHLDIAPLQGVDGLKALRITVI